MERKLDVHTHVVGGGGWARKSIVTADIAVSRKTLENKVWFQPRSANWSFLTNSRCSYCTVHKRWLWYVNFGFGIRIGGSWAVSFGDKEEKSDTAEARQLHL